MSAQPTGHSPRAQSYDVVIDDTSPLLTYNGGHWSQNQSSDAYGASYTMTTWQNDSVQLTFEGTKVLVNGSRSTFGSNFTVNLDGKPDLLSAQTTSGFQSFSTTIYDSGVLVPGQHTLEIINDSWDTLDIDSITYSCSIKHHGDETSELSTTTVDDTSSAFTYLPHGAWDVSSPNLPSFKYATGHSINLANASVNFTFSGDAVSIYGTTGPNHARYSVLRENRPTLSYSATKDLYSAQVLLYFGSGFGEGNHTVTLVTDEPGMFEMDYATVHSSSSLLSPLQVSSSSLPQPSQTGMPIIPTNPPPPQQKLDASAVAVIVVAAALFVLLVAAVFFLLRRNKNLWVILERGVHSPFDASVAPWRMSLGPRRAAKRATYVPVDDDESFESPPVRRDTVNSTATASTLVADAGSTPRNPGRPFFKQLQLATRWGSGPPSMTQTSSSTATMRQQLQNAPARSASTRRLLQDPSSASRDDLLGSSVDSHHGLGADDVLRHPIRRHEPSSHDWHAALP
ncbi:unnamed protein product [Mycena citricolor]|uniref:Transmembrane protein n=1 Tax=Mycena citricolor TaxID=2018698 RepID=A0AAD2H2X3_9AGAR|nr:unnamed protein product [Mycena citricolor]